ncbi:MAG: helix-turn-helix domain-containing protein [Armatimonadota bacterium]
MRETRREAGLSQADVAARLGQTQSWVSKCERGERRLDIIEVRAFCDAFGVPFPDFAQRLETAIRSNGARSLLERRA